MGRSPMSPRPIRSRLTDDANPQMTTIETDGLPLPRRHWAALTVGIGITMAVIDGSIANIALPTIARDLKATAAESIWIVNAYQLIVMVSLLPLSSLGELVGYRTIYRWGIVLFGIASLACAMADSLTTLTLARLLQGAGAAGIMSVNSALTRFTYPKAMLGRGIGITALVVATAAALGPTIAAGILSIATWPWLFAVNVPLSILAFAISRSLPETMRGSHRFDWTSAVLNAITIALVIVAIDDFGRGRARPDGYWLIGLEIAGAAICGLLLVRRQRGRLSPLLPIDLLKIPVFAMSICTSICSFAGQAAAYVTLPFFMQTVVGRSEVQTGLLMTPWPMTIMVVAPLAGRLADRYPSGLLGGIGMAIFACGLVSLAMLPPEPATLDIIWRMMLCGAGFALFQSPNNRTIIGSAPVERTGGASGMLGTARLLGQTIGAAMVALIFNLQADGTHTALYMAAGFALAGMVMSSLRLSVQPSVKR